MSQTELSWLSITDGGYPYDLPLLFLCDFGQDIRSIKRRMLIKIDSEVLIAASFLWVNLIVFYQNIRRHGLALYQIIDENWQNETRNYAPVSNIYYKLKVPLIYL